MEKNVRLRVNEAIARAQTNGKKILKKDVAAELWKGRNATAQQVNMTALCNGSTKQIRPEWVALCTAQFEGSGLHSELGLTFKAGIYLLTAQNIHGLVGLIFLIHLLASFHITANGVKQEGCRFCRLISKN